MNDPMNGEDVDATASSGRYSVYRRPSSRFYRDQYTRDSLC